MSSRSRTTRSAVAKAASTSPVSYTAEAAMLSGALACSTGAPGAMAASASTTASRGSYSTSISSRASSATCRLSAITTATGSPTKRTVSVASGCCGAGRNVSSWKKAGIAGGSAPRSAAEKASATPARASAGRTSTERSRACACGLRSTAMCSIPGKRRSSTNAASPRSSRGSSVRRTLAPTAWTPMSALPGLVRGPDRADDPLVAGAPAQVSGERLADLRVARPVLVPQQVVGGEQDAGGAEPALQAVVVPEGLLDRVQPVPGRQSLDRGQVGAVGLDGEQQAGADRLAVHQDGARPAHPVLAPHVRAGQAQVLAQEVGQRAPDRHGALLHGAVDGDPDRLLAYPGSGRGSADRRAFVDVQRVLALPAGGAGLIGGWCRSRSGGAQAADAVGPAGLVAAVSAFPRRCRARARRYSAGPWVSDGGSSVAA